MRISKDETIFNLRKELALTDKEYRQLKNKYRTQKQEYENLLEANIRLMDRNNYLELKMSNYEADNEGNVEDL